MSELESLREAVLRVRALHYEEDHECAECSFEPMLDAGFRGVSVPWPCPTVAALDGAPEPEWEYGHEGDTLVGVHANASRAQAIEDAEHLTRYWEPHGKKFRAVRRRKAGPWEPVGGEN